MRKDRILIEKSLIPYRFTIALTDVSHTLEIRYNSEADLFVIVLYDTDGNMLTIEPVIYGSEMFAQQYRAGIYPAVSIVPLDESGEETAVTWDNFNETVFLYIMNAAEDEA